VGWSLGLWVVEKLEFLCDNGDGGYEIKIVMRDWGIWVLLATTNRPSELDEAILWRLPQAFEIGIPDQLKLNHQEEPRISCANT
jgi:SpoVK/Ycf46/Vps4 family AAA+-type ATPase